MNKTLIFIRLFFAFLCVLFFITYTTITGVGGLNFTNIVIGLTAGLALGAVLICVDLLFLNKCNMRSFNIAILGLFLGYLLGQAIMLIAGATLNLELLSVGILTLLKTIVYLSCAYLGMIFTARASEELQLSIPFIKFKSSALKKKDILIDWSILMDSRIIDIASSGLLDEHLIVPRFMMTELYVMLESNDETTRNKARRCLDVFKKLEIITTLELRYSDVDFPDLKDPASKLIQLASVLDANIITADVARLQQYAVEGIRIINIHMLSNVLKPMVTGEHISIKVQRYGKEPRQGVGYLDDGTMVVVNGGAEFLGETIKAQVLSVKHTSSGRMIFCNAAEESMLDEPGLTSPLGAEINGNHKNYFAL